MNMVLTIDETVSAHVEPHRPAYGATFIPSFANKIGPL